MSAGAQLLGISDWYDQYQFCLNPAPTLSDLVSAFHANLTQATADTLEWQKQERVLNDYLFACAIAVTVDDGMHARHISLRAASARFPQAARVFPRLERMLNHSLGAAAGIRLGNTLVWRREWTTVVDLACDRLLSPATSTALATSATGLIEQASTLPSRLLSARMRIPEGFRCQDLTHHDVVAMADLSISHLGNRTAPVVVIGPRTAGAYFAPLAAARLRAVGFERVSWITLRPKSEPSPEERRQLSAIPRTARALVVDDHPNTGGTQLRITEILRAFGVTADRTVLVLPSHPARPHSAAVPCAARIFLPPEQQFKWGFLHSGKAAELVGGHTGCNVAAESPSTAALNARFRAGLQAGFQVRLKRVFDAGDRRIIAKSSGWGWFGYHAWLCGRALQGRVPQPLFYREGFLFSEWVEGGPPAANRRLAQQVAGYIARRVHSLPVEADPFFADPGYRWCGWNDLITILRRPYGPILGRLKSGAIVRHLRRFAAPHPVLVDGRMKPEDFISASGVLYKTDYEQHNFGGGELDLVDPAWDLAGSAYEFGFNAEDEQELLARYAGESGDESIGERLILHQCLYASNIIKRARYSLKRRTSDCERRAQTHQWHQARNFATFRLARFQGQALSPNPPRWTGKLFFLDLDGVLDLHVFGFPHSGPSGIAALHLLQQAGYSVVLNTARSVEHVREYAAAYGLAGGIAELGSVFYDAVSKREVPLIEIPALEQTRFALANFRRLSGCGDEPGYEYSLRVFRMLEDRESRLAPEQLAEAVSGCHRLELVPTGSATHVVARGASKAAALRHVVSWAGSPEQVVAMGDSDLDVEMLRAADRAYAPSNASSGARQVSRVMRGQASVGLLQAARELTGSREKLTVPDSAMAPFLRASETGRNWENWLKRGL